MVKSQASYLIHYLDLVTIIRYFEAEGDISRAMLEHQIDHIHECDCTDVTVDTVPLDTNVFHLMEFSMCCALHFLVCILEIHTRFYMQGLLVQSGDETWFDPQRQFINGQFCYPPAHTVAVTVFCCFIVSSHCVDR